MKGKTRDGRSLLYLAALVAVFVAYAALSYDRGLNFFAEGEVLGDAEGILQGKVLYRDIVTIYAPGRYYLLAGLLDIFGDNILVARLMWLSVRLAGGVVLFFLCRRMMPAPFSFIACLLYMFVGGPWFKAFFAFFNIPAVLCLTRYLDRKEEKWLAAAGLFSGAGIIFRQDTGLFMVVLGLSTILLSEGRGLRDGLGRALRSAAVFVAPAAALVLPVVAYFYMEGALSELLFWCFRWAVSVEYAFGLPFPNVLDPPDLSGGWGALKDYSVSTLFYYIPFPVLLAVSAILITRYVRGRSRKEDGYVAVVVLWGCMFAYKDVMAPLYEHAIQAALPVYILGCYLLSLFYLRVRDRYSERSFGKAAAGAVLAVSVALPVLAVYMHLTRWDRTPVDYMRRKPGQVRLNIERAPVYAGKALAANVEKVAKYITENTGEDDAIFADTVPVFYFLTGRRNASRYGVIQPMIFSRDPAEEKALVDMLRRDAAFIVHSEFILKRRRTWTFDDYAPLVSRFMRDECVLVMKAGPYELYRNARLNATASPSAP